MADPNRLRATAPRNAHGKLYEPKVAKVLSARLTPNSGAVAGFKGDMSMGRWLIESKTTVNSTMSLDLGWLVKITEEANTRGMNPALLVAFVQPDGRPKANAESQWVMMPLSHFQDLTDSK